MYNWVDENIDSRNVVPLVATHFGMTSNKLREMLGEDRQDWLETLACLSYGWEAADEFYAAEEEEANLGAGDKAQYRQKYSVPSPDREEDLNEFEDDTDGSSDLDPFKPRFTREMALFAHYLGTKNETMNERKVRMAKERIELAGGNTAPARVSLDLPKPWEPPEELRKVCCQACEFWSV